MISGTKAYLYFMKRIEIPQHSIVMTIGPSNSGKSYLCKMLCQYLTAIGTPFTYISSDEQRREVLGAATMHKHDHRMMAASKAAFEMLHLKLDIHTRFPINTPVVIVDATNLSKVSRSMITSYAKRNNYNLVGLLFDYKDQTDYFKYVDDQIDKWTIIDMVKMMRREVTKELDKSVFKAIHRLETIDFSDVSFEYNDSRPRGKKVEEANVCVVGDIHGCYEEFLEMLQDNKGITLFDDGTGIPQMVTSTNTTPYIHHVLIGDIVDKGPEEGVRKLIEFIYKNKQWFTIVEGNHERWNYQYLTGKIKDSKPKVRKTEVGPDGQLTLAPEETESETVTTQDLIDNYFTSVKMLQEDELLKNKFIHLYENCMFTYAYNDRFIVTHAPCENKYLGKEDKVSLKKMNTIMYPKSKDYEKEEEYLQATEDFFRFLVTDSESNYPYHVFGHVMLKSVFMNKNKVGLDLGCVVGGYLATATFDTKNRKPYIKKYKSKQPETKVLHDLFRTRHNEVHFGALDIDLQKRIKWCAKNGVNFISGTMSPVDKDMEDNDIESLAMGLKYYMEKGVMSFILEPKFMGSRCNMLLHKDDVTKCKSFSRNAYEIKNERLNSDKTLEELYAELQLKHKNVFEGTNSEYILFDGELLPWNAMGKDLIERDFMVAYKACNSEHELLRQTGFEDMLFEFEQKYDGATPEELKPHELKMKNVYDGFREDVLHIDEMQVGLDKYKHQLDLFGADGVLDFKAFAILKTIAYDGTEENWINGDHTNLAMFDLISKDPYCFINIDETNGRAVIAKAGTRGQSMEFEYYAEAINWFWDYVTNNKEMEGVVLKPNKAYIPGVAPYLKCRNKEYLRLTYGFDYDLLEVKTDRLLKNKSIRRKLETSVKEYELGRQILDIPMKEISVDNPKWLSLCLQLINEQNSETELDPRL